MKNKNKKNKYAKRPKHARRYLPPNQRQQVRQLLSLWKEQKDNQQENDFLYEKYEHVKTEIKPSKEEQSTRKDETTNENNV